MRKFYTLTIDDRGISDVNLLDDDDLIITKRRYDELTRIETRYREHLHELATHTMVEDYRLTQLLNIEAEYNDLKQRITIDEFKLHYQVDPIKYAVHILKEYLRAYLNKHTTKSTGIVEKRMLVVSFCHRIEEGLIDYLDELEEFNK